LPAGTTQLRFRPERSAPKGYRGPRYLARDLLGGAMPGCTIGAGLQGASVLSCGSAPAVAGITGGALRARRWPGGE